MTAGALSALNGISSCPDMLFSCTCAPLFRFPHAIVASFGVLWFVVIVLHLFLVIVVPPFWVF